MSYLTPFFSLLGRAAVFWVGLGVLVCLSILLTGLAQPDEPQAPYVNIAFLAAFAFPAAAGWLAGAVIQEFQHSTVAWTLPDVRKRLALGFSTTGVVVAAFVAAYASLSASAQNPFLLLMIVGIAGYCLGGVLLDPVHRWLTSLNPVVVLLVFATSRYLSEVAARHPLWFATGALGTGLLAFSRLFARSTFRRKPFIASMPFPGAYTLERSAEFDRAREAQRRRRRVDWKGGYLGTDLWRWARAAAYESYGQVDWRAIPAGLSRLWPLSLLFAIAAWSDKGELGFWESLGKTIHESLLDSPHAPPFGHFGEGSGPAPILVIGIAAAGAALALWYPATLRTSTAYPLSRRGLAGVAYRAGLVDVTGFFVVVGGALWILGTAAGWLVGYETRFDFVPFFFRALAGTVILMPLARWAGLSLGIAIQRKTGNTLLPMVLGIVGFIVVVSIWSYQSPRLFQSPVAELGASVVLFATAQAILWRQLRTFYATRDLV